MDRKKIKHLSENLSIVGWIVIGISFFLMLHPKTMGHAPMIVITLTYVFWFLSYHVTQIVKLGEYEDKIKLLEDVERQNRGTILAIGGKRLLHPYQSKQKIEIVYLLKCGDWFKIGYTSNLNKRINALSTGSPYPIELIHSFVSKNAQNTEKSLHRLFQSKRGSGEWFALTPEEVGEIKHFTGD